MPSTALTRDRYLVAAAIFLTCALFLTAALDPVNIVKLTALLIIAIALIVSVTARVVQERIVQLPASPAGAVGMALLVAFVVSAVVAPVSTTAVLGAYGRNSGLLAYLAALVLFLVGLRVFDRPGARVLVGGVVAAGLFTASYGLLQKIGWDAISWNNPFNPIIAALGNPNFASGYLGISASVAAGGALWAGWSRGWRIACTVTALLCLLAAGLSGSVQGPIAAAGGLSVVALAWVLDLPARRRRVGLGVLGTVAAAGVAALTVGAVAKAGPAGAIFTDSGSSARVFYWDAALNMLADKPLLGVGLDQYGNFWRTMRSPGSVDSLGGGGYADAAHSVPLQMLAQGGLLLGLAYFSLVLLTLVALARGLLRLSGSDRILLAAVGGGWTAYQVQSAVSIDQVPLIVLHFTLASAVVACAGAAGLRELRLPGAPKPVPVHPHGARGKPRAPIAAPKRRTMNNADVAIVSVVAFMALVAVWQAFLPLRANMAAKAAANELARGNGNAAVTEYQHANELMPGQAYYFILRGNFYDRVSQPALAQAAYQEAVAKDPYAVNAITAAAARAETNGDLDQSRTLHQRAVTLDPFNSETLVEAATFELRHGGAKAARGVLEVAVVRLPNSGPLWGALGDARAVLGDTDGARQAYGRALVAEPGQAAATQGLAKLGA